MNSSSSSWKVPSLVSIGAILPLYLFLLIIFHTNIQQVNGEMTTIQLPIPGRHQWPDRDGYCGSNSIQMNMLYHGALCYPPSFREPFVRRRIITPGTPVKRL